jgi:hypothetical protein
MNNGTLSPNRRVPSGYRYFFTSFVTGGLYISGSQTFVVSFPSSGLLTSLSAMGMAKDNESVQRDTPGFGPGGYEGSLIRIACPPVASRKISSPLSWAKRS